MATSSLLLSKSPHLHLNVVSGAWGCGSCLWNHGGLLKEQHVFRSSVLCHFAVAATRHSVAVFGCVVWLTVVVT